MFFIVIFSFLSGGVGRQPQNKVYYSKHLRFYRGYLHRLCIPAPVVFQIVWLYILTLLVTNFYLPGGVGRQPQNKVYHSKHLRFSLVYLHHLCIPVRLRYNQILSAACQPSVFIRLYSKELGQIDVTAQGVTSAKNPLYGQIGASLLLLSVSNLLETGSTPTQPQRRHCFLIFIMQYIRDMM